MPPSIPEAIGKYAIERWIESGGMGDIYLARDPTLDRPVAIKFLREGFDNEEMRERFEREARAAGRLSHPNIVTIYEFGEFGGRPFIAMEFVPGESLSKLIRRKEPIPLVRKLEMMEGLCAGLAHAHRAGIVHRDIKPANLMVDAEGSLKVLDFGIVRMAGSGLTNIGVLVGTVNYMSPEQIAGSATIDHRSDVFAVGTVLYEIFAYKRAFPGEMAEVLYRIVHAEPEPIGNVAPSLDPVIQRAVGKCLEKSPDKRYQDLTALRRELARVRQRLETEEPHDPPSLSGATLVGRSGPVTPPPTSDSAIADARRQAESARRQRDVEQQRLEAERQRQAEAERQRQAELERQRQADAERQRQSEHQRQAELERQRQADAARQRAEADRQRDAEAERRQREVEEAAQRAAAEEQQARDAVERQRPTEDQRKREELAARQRQRDEKLQAAQQAIEADRTTQARAALDEAAALGATPETLATIKRRLDEHARQFQRLTQCLQEGDALFRQGALDQAMAAAAEALRLRPANKAATELRDRVQAAVDRQLSEAQRRQQQIEGWLRDARAATQDDHAIAALTKVFELDPANEQARALLDALRKAQEERKRQRAALLVRGRKAVSEGRFAEAVQALRALAVDAEDEPGLVELLQQAEAGFEIAEAERRREEALAASLAAAADRLAREDFKAAKALVQDVLAKEPSHAKARTLREAIVKAEELLARAENTVEKAQALVERQQMAEALEILERFVPPHPLVASTLTQLREQHAAAERERLRVEQRARRQQAFTSAAGRGRSLASHTGVRLGLGLVLVALVGIGVWSRWPPTPVTPGPSGGGEQTPQTPGGNSGKPDEIVDPQVVQEKPGTRTPTNETEKTPPGAPPPGTTPPGTASPGRANPSAPPVDPNRRDPPASQTVAPANEGASGTRAPAGGTDSAPASETVRQTEREPERPPERTPDRPAERTPDRTPSARRWSAERTPPTADPRPTVSDPTPPRGETAPPPPDPREVARQDIQRWVRAYEQAYAAMDVARLRQMVPAVAHSLERQKGLLRSASVRVSNEQIEVAPDAQSATLRATFQYHNEFERGRPPTLAPVSLTWKLVRNGNGWIVR